MKKATLGDVAGAKYSTGGATDSVPLAERINALHHEVEQHKTQMLLKARTAGELLLEVKRSLKHGEYLAWLEANFEGSQPKAWRYTRIAERWDVIAANYSTVNDLSISEALRIARYGYGRRGGA
jgi:hypothetical protein